MDKIKNILKPKSEEEIRKAVCQKYDIKINGRDTQTLMDLIYMTNIIDMNKGPIYFITTTKKEIDEMPIMTISYDVFSPKDVEFTLSSWTEIFNKFMYEILKIATFPSELKIDRAFKFRNKYKCLQIANYIAMTSRGGPGNFIIISKDKKFEFEDISLKIIITDKIQNKIIIGRKNNVLGGVIDPGITILKNKDKYAVFTVPDSEKNYFYMNI